MSSQPSPIRFIRLPEVQNQTGLSRSYIYRLESEGRFPTRVKLGVLASAWIESEVQRWCESRVEAARGAV